jgi:hypothetical protein
VGKTRRALEECRKIRVEPFAHDDMEDRAKMFFVSGLPDYRDYAFWQAISTQYFLIFAGAPESGAA